MIAKLLQYLPWRRERLLDAVARQVADQCVDGVCRRATLAIDAMSVCEARGYLRARAAVEIATYGRQALAAVPNIPADWRQAIIARAADRVAPLALRRLSAAVRSAAQEKPSSAPVVRRKAA